MTEPPRRSAPPGATARGGSRSPSSIGALLEHARDVSAQAGGVSIDRESWRRAVGERIATRTEPGRLRGSVLTVHVASAAWAQELTFFTTELIERVNALGVPAATLRFVVRPLSTQAAPRPAASERPARPRAPLPPDLEARLKLVADPVLRAAIAEAASLGLAQSASSAPRARGPKSAGARSAPSAKTSPDVPRGPRRKP